MDSYKGVKTHFFSGLVILWIFLLCLTLGAPLLSAQEIASTDLKLFHYSHFINRQELRTHVGLLASDSLEGRGLGTFGSCKASEYIAGQLKNEGLYPIGDRETYFQPVVFKQWYRDKAEFLLTLPDGKIRGQLMPGRDFTFNLNELPMPYSLSADHLMFAGYGIADDAYNDFKYAQAWDEVLLILDGEPMEKGKYVISNTIQPSSWSLGLDRKLQTAVHKGAKAVILIEDSTTYVKRGASEYPGRGKFAEQIVYNYPIPVIRVSEAALVRLFAPKEHARLAGMIARVKRGDVASNYVQGGFKIDLSITHTLVRDRNVVGLIEGDDPRLKHEYIVLSAHFDHLGIINGEIFNGADDNATGTAALISISKALKALKDNGYPLKRSVLFLFCTGEESGLLGSRYFVNNPLVPLKHIKADINIDMIGRRDTLHAEKENYLYVIGSDKINPLLDDILNESNDKTIRYGLDYTYNNVDHPLRLYYRSDHYNFAEKGIPSVFLFGGFHKDYHRPSDDTMLIDFKKVEDISKLVFFTTVGLSNYSGEIKTDYKP
ncbi:MAG TPA: M20/M25/M40 family metallo-hydrolase [Saprospiraceae bacterium]|nr:M20/M25/M40 family metallo-hydrolase [Saprospiraceae bacterium]